MKKFIAVGINNFLVPGNDLSECVADANDMVAFSEKLGAFPISPILNAAAVKGKIFDQLKELQAEAKRGELTYLGIAWSGHGTHYSRLEEPDGLGEGLACYDITATIAGAEWNPKTIIKDVEFRNFLNGFPPTCLVEVWLDTCYSGGMDRAFILSFMEPPPYRNKFIHNPRNTKNLTRIANSSYTVGLHSNIIMWCACSEAQTAADAPSLLNGAFTFFWLRAYNKKPKASRVEILLDTRAGLMAGGYSQFPRLKCYNAPAQLRVGS